MLAVSMVCVLRAECGQSHIAAPVIEPVEAVGGGVARGGQGRWQGGAGVVGVPVCPCGLATAVPGLLLLGCYRHPGRPASQ